MIVRLFADDVRAALASLKTLKYFATIFDKAERLALLSLKASKCFLVPLFECDLEVVTRQAGAWLAKHIPKWRHFKVVGASTYLGFEMGPLAGVKQNDKVFAKWSTRGHTIAEANLAWAPGMLAYNTYASTLVLQSSAYSF